MTCQRHANHINKLVEWVIVVDGQNSSCEK